MWVDPHGNITPADNTPGTAPLWAKAASKNFSMTMDDYMEKINRLHGGIVYERVSKVQTANV